MIGAALVVLLAFAFGLAAARTSLCCVAAVIGAVALWLPGRPVDVHPGTPVTVTLDGTHHATAYDPLNGVEQALRVEHEGGQTVIPGLLVRDCPVLVRVT